MNITGISANDPIFGASSQGNTDALGKDAFLQLLVSQLQNQDPLEPTGNQEFVAQLAQFSTLEGIEEMNENLVGLAVLQQGNALLSQLTDSSALIGKSVRYLPTSGGAETTGVVQSVKIDEGFATLNIGGQDVPLGNVLEVEGDAGVDTTGDATGDAAAEESGTEQSAG